MPGINKKVNPNEDKEKQFIDFLSLVTTVEDDPKNTGVINKSLGFLQNNLQGVTKIKVTQRQLDAIKYLFVRNKLDWEQWTR